MGKGQYYTLLWKAIARVCRGHTSTTAHDRAGAAMCWVKGIRPPQPEQIHADGNGTLFLG